MPHWRSAVITRSELISEGKPYTAYVIAVMTDDDEYEVYRRYREFDELNKAIRKAYPMMNFPAQLPPKQMFGSMNTTVVAKRQRDLNNWLQAVVDNPALAALAAVALFLQRPAPPEDGSVPQTVQRGAAAAGTASGSRGTSPRANLPSSEPGLKSGSLRGSLRDKDGGPSASTAQRSSVAEASLALYHASLEGNMFDVKRILGTTVADINAPQMHGYRPLDRAASRGHGEVVKALAEAGASINAVDAEGDTALHLAAQEGYTAITAFLLEAGALADMPDNDGDTPLILAAAAGHSKIVAMLIDAKVNVNHKGENGNTALHWALLMSHVNIVNTLLDHGASINSPNNQGNTPLLSACMKKDEDLITLLVNRGADVTLKGEDGDTALHICAGNGLKSSVTLLMQHYADINAVNDNDQTPLSLARECGHSSVTKMLKEAGGTEIEQEDDGGMSPEKLMQAYVDEKGFPLEKNVSRKAGKGYEVTFHITTTRGTMTTSAVDKTEKDATLSAATSMMEKVMKFDAKNTLKRVHRR